MQECCGAGLSIMHRRAVMQIGRGLERECVGEGLDARCHRTAMADGTAQLRPDLHASYVVRG
jgi:predicted signal transduction protein with EAL and GGDEF domain